MNDSTAGVSACGSDVINVRVRDHAAENWGVGPVNPAVRTVTISAHCPCGARRGTPRNLNQYDDGCHYSTDVWINPCGHVDMYDNVIREAAALAGAA